jgi:hypothetical protein
MKPESSPMHRMSIESVIRRILESGMITNADKNWLYRATLSEIYLTNDELNQVRRVMDRLQMGLVRVVE